MLTSTLVCSLILSQTSIQFADIPYGIKQEEAKAQMVAKGYSLLPDLLNDLSMVFFSGIVAGKDTKIMLHFDEEYGYQSAFLTFQPDRGKAFSLYDDLKETLEKKYGQANRDLKEFSRPYYLGDGYEETAVWVGKADVIAIWQAEDKKPLLAIQLQQAGNISIIYTGPHAVEMHEKDTAKRAADL